MGGYVVPTLLQITSEADHQQMCNGRFVEMWGAIEVSFFRSTTGGLPVGTRSLDRSSPCSNVEAAVA